METYELKIEEIDPGENFEENDFLSAQCFKAECDSQEKIKSGTQEAGWDSRIGPVGSEPINLVSIVTYFKTLGFQSVNP